MSQPVISVENLSKAYRIGLKDEIPDTLVGAMTNIARSPFKNFKRLRSLDTFRDVKSGHGDSDDILWALKDVSFDVQEGEVVGIIGRNGAGKSTLLKILSRITEPTSGRIKIRGRVSSLLEVGTGFHPELTGRENIYMNGTILGMTKREIDSKFDEIVDFSGVEKFLDTPVKRYSSGMSVRLAFAVAAHLEPEILIIDEVLAVGDAEFQKKCLGKMKDVAGEGRTVLFVSHNMAAVESLCGSGFVIENGRNSMHTDITETIAVYRNAKDCVEESSRDLSLVERRAGADGPRMTRVTLLNEAGNSTSSFQMGQPISLQVDFAGFKNKTVPVLGVVVKSPHNHPLFGVNNRFIKNGQTIEPSTAGQMTCHLGAVPLLPGAYSIDLFLGNEYRDWDVVEEALSFSIERSDYYGTGKLPPPSAGPIRWSASWT